MLSRKFPNDSFQMLHLFFPCVFTCPYSSFLLLSHLIPTHREKVQLAAPLTEADDYSKAFYGTFLCFVILMITLRRA